jgi:hypothetical protein
MSGILPCFLTSFSASIHSCLGLGIEPPGGYCAFQSVGCESA